MKRTRTYGTEEILYEIEQHFWKESHTEHCSALLQNAAIWTIKEESFLSVLKKLDLSWHTSKYVSSGPVRTTWG